MSANRFKGLSIPFVLMAIASVFAGPLGVTIAMATMMLVGTMVICTDELSRGARNRAPAEPADRAGTGATAHDA